MKKPTPETDAVAEKINFGVDIDFARKLERERDEALMDRARGETATMTINHYERILRERDEWAAMCGRYKQERDEARDVLEEVSLNLSSGIGDENTTAQQYKERIFDGIKHLAGHAWEERCKFEQERDEARAELSLKQQTLTIAEGTLSDLRKQRDEWSAMCGRYKQERDIAEQDATNYHARIIELIDERDKTKRERDEAWDMVEKLTEQGLKLMDDNMMLKREIKKFKKTIRETLEENRHLADGDDCTLRKLKSIVPDWK